MSPFARWEAGLKDSGKGNRLQRGVAKEASGDPATLRLDLAPRRARLRINRRHPAFLPPPVMMGDLALGYCQHLGSASGLPDEGIRLCLVDGLTVNKRTFSILISVDTGNPGSQM